MIPARLKMFLPGVLVGGLLFGGAFVHASAGSDLESWPASGDELGGGGGGDDATPARRAQGRRVADAPRTPPMPPRTPPPGSPAPPAPPAPPTPPTPPTKHRAAGGRGGLSVTIHDGKVQIHGIDEFARAQIEAVRQMLRNNPNIPPDVRDRVLGRMDRARAALDRRLKNLSVDDLDNLDAEMEKMGDELEKAFEGLEADLEKLGDKLGKDFAKKFGKDVAKRFKPGKIQLDFHRDGDDPPDPPDPPDPSDHDDDVDDDHGGMPTPDVEISSPDVTDVSELKDIKLKPEQRARIVRLRSNLVREVEVAQKQLEDASRRLETALDDVNAKDEVIVRYVDQITSHEAAIRKARLLTWMQARRLLDPAQRKKVEDASRKRHR
jgi:hypothetical protein